MAGRSRQGGAEIKRKVEKVVVVYKKSSLQYFRDQGVKDLPRDPVHRNKISASALKKSDQELRDSIQAVQQILIDDGIKVRKVYRANFKGPGDADLVLTVGGDGTFLEAARYCHEVPIMGVNADPGRSVGSFTASDSQNFKKVLRQYCMGLFKVQKLARMQVRINGRPAGMPVLNEMLFCSKHPAMTCRYIIEAGEKQEDHYSSGIWICTPAGSRAATHSAGGKVMQLGSRRLQYRVRELFQRPHEPRCRLSGGIFSADSHLRIINKNVKAVLFLDGAHVRIPVKLGDKITVALFRHPLNWVMKKKS